MIIMLKQLSWKTIATVASLATFLGLAAPEARAGANSWSLTTGLMLMTNSTEQGGQGPEGSTLLTHSELYRDFNWWGVGTFFQYDKQGTAEVDTAIGPMAHMFFGPFYAELGYALMLNQGFTDRTVANRKGTALYYGIGVRVGLGQAASNPAAKGFFLDFSYKFRTQFIKEQDGVILTEKITQKDSYPIFGLGMAF
jgi:hypothetical protein